MWPSKERITEVVVEEIIGPGKKLEDLGDSWFTKHLIIAIREVICSLLLVIQAVYKSMTVREASGTELDDKGYDYGVDRNAATKAQHIVTLCKSATVKHDLPIPDGFLLTTTPVQNGTPVKFSVVSGQEKFIAEGENSCQVIVECTEYGEVGNVPDGAINLVAQAGFDSVVDSQLYNKGVAEEDDDSYRERILARKRRPPKAGVLADWERWALEVPGVTKPTAYRTARGPGTVDVVIRGPDGGLPEEGLISACQELLATYTPADMAGDGVLVCGPEIVPIDFKLANVEIREGYDEVAAISIIESALERFFSESASIERLTVVDCIVTIRTAYDQSDSTKTPILENFSLIEPSEDIYLTGRQDPKVRSIETV